MANIINGSAGADGLNGLSGDNVINGFAGADKLNGGAGLDTLDGGSGSDTISGNSGDDTLIYRAAENTGSMDVYDGGSGKDYLQLNLTLAEWNSAAVQTDIASYLNFIDLNTQWRTLEANNAEFRFTAFNLVASKIEFLRVVVDGVVLSPEDNVVALGADAMNATENGAGTGSNLFANDSVLDQVKTFSFTQAAHGVVSIVQDFSVVNAPSAVATYTPTGTYWDYLAAGQTATDSFTYTVTDADNDTQTATVTVTITGTNDVVTVTSGPQAGAVVEDAAATPSPTDSVNAAGTVAFTDVDLADTHSVSFAASPANLTSLGTFALGSVSEAPNAASGSVGWTYGLNNGAAQYLAAGQVVTETYTVTVDDGHGSTTTQDVVITITGTNDAPVITAQDLVGAVTEQVTPAGNLTDSGVISFTDVDLTDVHTVSTVAVGTTLGVLTAAKDSDTTDTGTGGQLTWTYTVADSDVEYLAKDQTKVETFTVTLDDGHGGVLTRDVVVTITGTNDAPVITAQDLVGAVTEQVTPAGDLTDSGVISFTDVDLTDAHLVSPTGTPVGTTLGALTVAENSDTTTTGTGGQLTWTYTVPASTVEYLAAGQTKVESFTITLDDQHGGLLSRQIDVTITGTNDVVTVTSGPQAGAVVEDAAATPSPTDSLNAAGTVAFTDVDLADTHSVSFAASPANLTSLGTFALGSVSEAPNAASGSVGWTYELDNAAAQSLAGGQVVTETYTVTVDDAHGSTTTQDVVITITGTNDAPVITIEAGDSASSGLLESNAGLLANGHVTVTDVDAGDVATLSVDSVSIDAASTGATAVTPAALKAMMSVGQDGGWHFNSGSEAFDNLAAGQTLVLDYVLKADDGDANDTQTVTVTITGTNDAPVAATLIDQNSNEDTAFSFTAPASTDVDGDSLTYTATRADGSALPSWLSFDATTRTFSGTPPQDFNGAVAVKMTTSDGSLTDSKTFNLAINPVNDAPVAVADTLAATEDTPATYTAAQLLGNDTDVDNPNSALSIASVTSGAGGTAVLNANGTVTFTPNADFNGQASFAYTTTDGALTSDPATVTVNVAAVNDPPVFTSGSAGSVAENAPISTVVYDANATDVDGAPAVFSLTGTDAGLFDINSATGEVTFKVSPNFEAPADAGANNVYDFSVSAFDGTATISQAVAITVTNVNEAPVIDTDGGGANAIVSVNENTTAVTTVHATDPDAGTTLIYSISGGADAGKFTINAATGVLSFISAPNFEAPTDADADNSYIVQVQAFDGALQDDQTITVNVADVAEAPVDTQGPTSVGFTLATAGATTDNGATLGANGAIGTFVAQGDPNSSVFHYALTGADAGLFTFNTATGALAIGGSALGASPTPYALTVTALDQANNAFSQDVKVWVGGSGDQLLVGVGANVDLQYGMNGTDTLNGGAGNDALVGGAGSDLLIGGGGFDQLFGGASGDAFRFTGLADATDKILDFTTTGGNADAVQLSVPGFSLQNQATVGTGAVTMVDAGVAASSIAGADIVRWTGPAASMDSAAEINAMLAGKTGTFAGGVFVLGFDATGKAALWYDDSANNAASSVTMVATFDNLASTSSFTASDFLFV